METKEYYRLRAIQNAQELYGKTSLILDTETTGLDSNAEICEITIIESPSGKVVLNERVRPGVPISPVATEVHGISDEDVADCPKLETVLKKVEHLLLDKEVTIGIYNAKFDLRLIDQALGKKRFYIRRPNVVCIQEIYADFFGEWNPKYGNNKWQSLEKASAQCNLEWEGEAHSALADCLMTLKVLKHVAEQPDHKPTAKNGNFPPGVTAHPSNPRFRVYETDKSAVFRRNKDEHGILSNMYPLGLSVNGNVFGSSEALYQACRFTEHPDSQVDVMMEKNPMQAKTKAHEMVNLSRKDWMKVRVEVMRWVLRVKLVCNQETFGKDLLSTGDKPIVEFSTRDQYWGANMQSGKLVGTNALGRLLMELRQEYREATGVFEKGFVAPPDIPDFYLLGMPIENVPVNPLKD